MRIGVDIDNVLSNFNEVLLNDYIRHDKELGNSGIIKDDVYIRDMFNWSKDEEQKYYHDNIERLANLFEPIKDCSKYIKELRDNGHYICIISGRDNGEYSDPYNMTTKWLEKYGIQYDKIILTNAYNHQEKADICIENNIDIMIDDSTNVCEKCSENNIKPLLFGTDYNKHETRYKRVNNWKEIFDYVNNYKKEKINVILDTDTYNECDDQFALAYMIKSQDIFNINAITVAPYSHTKRNETVISGQEKSYNEILKICNWLNFDTENKVFKGSQDYICNGYKEDNDAVNKIIEIALQNEKTYIMAIGAITNIALAIKKEPKIVEKIEVIWLGGNKLGYKDNLEYNFKQDIEAVKIVFNSKVNLTVFPCQNVVSKLKIDINTLKENLTNKSKLCNYLIDRFYNDGYHGVQKERVIWDISVIAYMINSNWFLFKQVSCPDIGDDTSYKSTKDQHKVKFITDINRNDVYNDLFKKLNDSNERMLITTN